LWGIVLPQTLWLTEFSVDWYQAQGLVALCLGALLAVAVPTTLLYEGRDTLGKWDVSWGSTRLFALALLSGWVMTLGTELLDHSYQLSSSSAYAAALIAVVLSGAAVMGLIAVRVWALLACVGSVLALAWVPVSVADAIYAPSYGYIDVFVAGTTGTSARLVLSSLIPIAVIGIVAGPFLHAFFKKILGRL